MIDMGRAVRSALAPEVDAHSGSFLGRRWGGMSGPVWSLAAWFAVMAVIQVVNVIALGIEGAPVAVRLVAIALWSGWTVALAVLRDRTPGWLLHLLLDSGIVLTCLIAMTAASDIRSVSQLMFVIVPAVYAATWFGRQQMAMHLLVLVVMSGAAVIGYGVLPDSGRAYVVLMVLAIGLAYFVNALVQHLNQQATIDPVSGLLNRIGLQAVADSLASRGGHGLERAVAVMDLDGFKSINDRDGHAAGDAILREVGDVMRAQLRPSDTIARTGGDEFVIVLVRTSLAQAEQIVARLVRALPVACSYGIADWPAGEAFVQSMGLADEAMYAHKRANRGDPGQVQVRG
jgi:diguanylate cyclase (GGDEF)-like protein